MATDLHRQLASREPLRVVDLGSVQDKLGVFQLGMEAVQSVLTAIGDPEDVAEGIPVLHADSQLLLHLAARRLLDSLAAAHVAPGQVPAPVPVGMADQKHPVFVGEHALDAVQRRSPHEPPQSQQAMRDAVGLALETYRHRHGPSVRGRTRRVRLKNCRYHGREPREGARLVHAMKTFTATPSNRERNWLVVDASEQTLGRLATRIADALRGKDKPTYTPHIDTGDFVIVVNAEKVAVTGNKRVAKRYYRHSGYPGGLRSRTLEQMLERRPEEVIRLAVKGMLPRNRLARKQLTKLKIYAGPDHPHAAQKPQPMEVQR